MENIVHVRVATARGGERIHDVQGHGTGAGAGNREGRGFLVSPYSPRFSLWNYPLLQLSGGERSRANEELTLAPLSGTLQRSGKPVHEPFCEDTQSQSPFPASPSNNDTGSSIVRVVFAGDLMPMDGDAPPEASECVRRIIERAELVVVNLESPVDRETTKPTQNISASAKLEFGVSTEFVRASLLGVGCQNMRKVVVSVANNHAGDQGPVGLSGTVERLQQTLGITTIGLLTSGSAHDENQHPLRGLHATCIKLTNGCTLGLVAWTSVMNWPSKRTSDVIPVAREEDVLQVDWREAKKRLHVDIFVGFVHWDREQSCFPTSGTVGVARTLISRGMDAIVGHGPHVVQPIEVIDSRCPVAYSIGNLCSERGPWQTKLGGIFELQIDRNYISKFELHPFFQAPSQKTSKKGQSRHCITHLCYLDLSNDSAPHSTSMTKQEANAKNAGSKFDNHLDLVANDSASLKLKHKFARRIARLFPFRSNLVASFDGEICDDKDSSIAVRVFFASKVKHTKNHADICYTATVETTEGHVAVCSGKPVFDSSDSWFWLYSIPLDGAERRVTPGDDFTMDQVLSVKLCTQLNQAGPHKLHRFSVRFVEVISFATFEATRLFPKLASYHNRRSTTSDIECDKAIEFVVNSQIQKQPASSPVIDELVGKKQFLDFDYLYPTLCTGDVVMLMPSSSAVAEFEIGIVARPSEHRSASSPVLIYTAVRDRRTSVAAKFEFPAPLCIRALTVLSQRDVAYIVVFRLENQVGLRERLDSLNEAFISEQKRQQGDLVHDSLTARPAVAACRLILRFSDKLAAKADDAMRQQTRDSVGDVPDPILQATNLAEQFFHATTTLISESAQFGPCLRFAPPIAITTCNRGKLAPPSVMMPLASLSAPPGAQQWTVREVRSIMDSLSTGDLVFCTAVGESQISHASLILRIDGAPSGNTLFVLDANEVCSRASTTGIELVGFEESVRSGSFQFVAIRRFVGLSQAKRDRIAIRLTEVLENTSCAAHPHSHATCPCAATSLNMLARGELILLDDINDPEAALQALCTLNCDQAPNLGPVEYLVTDPSFLLSDHFCDTDVHHSPRGKPKPNSFPKKLRSIISSNVPASMGFLHGKHLKSGDIVLFCGTVGSSVIVRSLLGSAYSHVGIVLTGKVFENDDSAVAERPRLLHATWDTFEADGTQEVQGEVMLIDLERALQQYHGEREWAYARVLNTPESIRQHIHNRLRRMCREHIGDGFAHRHVLGARIPDLSDYVVSHATKYVRGGVKDDTRNRRWFCSRFVAESLIKAGVLDERRRPAQWAPKNLSSETHTLRKHCVAPFSYSAEMCVDFPDTAET